MISASATARMIRKFPISNIALWAWLMAPAPATSLAVRPKKVLAPVAMTTPCISPCLTMLPEWPSSPPFFARGKDSPGSAAWSMEAYSPPTSRRSAGTMTPSLILTMSPGTSVAVATSCHLPSRIAVASGASPFPQRGQRVGCLAVLPEFERGIEEQQRCDDGEVVPMPDDGRNDRGGLDHVGVRAGEVPHDLAKQADLFFNEGGLGPHLASRSRASALLSPCSGLTASWARTFSTGTLSRSIAACDPTSGARVADCRATADMDCSLERVHGDLKRSFQS